MARKLSNTRRMVARNPGGAPRIHESCPLGQAIDGLAAGRGMLLAEIADRVGLSLSSMHDIRRGVFRPRLDTLDRIAKVFHVDTSTLLSSQ